VGAEEELDRRPFVVAEGIGTARVERVDRVLLARIEFDLERDGRPEAVDGPGRDLARLARLRLPGGVDLVDDRIPVTLRTVVSLARTSSADCWAAGEGPGWRREQEDGKSARAARTRAAARTASFLRFIGAPLLRKILAERRGKTYTRNRRESPIPPGPPNFGPHGVVDRRS